MKFKDQTLYALAKSKRRSSESVKAEQSHPSTWKPPCIRSLKESEDIQAIAFFFNNVVLPGRGKESTKGLFETILPLYTRCDQESPLSHSILATAVLILAVGRGECADALVPSKYFDVALASLQIALRSQSQNKQNEILMATLLLQLREGFVAISQSREVSSVHHSGTVSLVKHRGRRNYEDEASKYLLLGVLHNEINSAIRHGYQVDADLVAKCCRKSMPLNSSFELDKLGVGVAELQARYEVIKTQEPACLSGQCIRQRDLTAIHDQASALEKDLQIWARSVPSHWLPFRLNDVKSSISAYGNFCEIYPTIEIASIWNAWRRYRLIILKVMIACDIGALTCNVCPNTIPPARESERERTKEMVRECISAVSHSVPFFLGNRQDPYDHFFVPSDLEFPSYRCLSEQDLASLPFSRQCSVLTREEHSRHVLAQGAWHILSHLGHVLVILMDTVGQSMKSYLDSEQIHWIEGQLIRAAFLFRPGPNMSLSDPIWAEDGRVQHISFRMLAQRHACLV
ncbi:hypothetical protein LTR84_001332 [Exophiala bonariae]|uniref:Transcription factor domain-containing protein n=1 Tax=Exophiala bonariae TaxID=1690606 RepID=A0AAV9NC27_9EURO|nr:hypothetical protein LTR84_001332 [Exophiala bonariae]